MRRKVCALVGGGVLATALVVAPVGVASAEDSVVQFEVVESTSSGVLSLDIVSLTQLESDGGLVRYLLRMMVQGRGTLTVSADGEILATRSVDSIDEPFAVELEVVLPPGATLLEVEFVAPDGLSAETANLLVDVPGVAPPTGPETADVVQAASPQDPHGPLAETGTTPPWVAVLLGASLAVLGLAFGARARCRPAVGRMTHLAGKERPMA